MRKKKKPPRRLVIIRRRNGGDFFRPRPVRGEPRIPVPAPAPAFSARRWRNEEGAAVASDIRRTQTGAFSVFELVNTFFGLPSL